MSTIENSTETGILKRLQPPGNNGLGDGTGIIEGEDKVSYTFITPTANHNQELKLYEAVTFILDDAGTVISVSRA